MDEKQAPTEQINSITQTPHQYADQSTKESSCKKDDRLKIDFHEIKRKKDLHLDKQFKRKVVMQMKNRPPKINELLEADQLMYIKNVLDETVLTYKYLSYESLYGNTEWNENKSLDESLDENETLLELEELFHNKSNFIAYERAIKILPRNSKKANDILVELANNAVQPACHAVAVIFFKETSNKYNILNNFEGNNEYVENSGDNVQIAVKLLQISNHMQPACSFILGMLKRYNVGNINRFLSNMQDWQEDLIEVIQVAAHGIFNISQYVWDAFDIDNTRNCRLGMGMKKKIEYLNEMSQFAIYEISRSMSPKVYISNAQIELLNILTEAEFPHALFLYSALLLQKKIGRYYAVEKTLSKAIDYLNRAISEGHHMMAKFLLGILPFYNRYGPELTSQHQQISQCIEHLEDYIESSSGECLADEKNIDKAVKCLAEQYNSKAYFLMRDQHKAKKLLISRNLHEK